MQVISYEGEARGESEYLTLVHSFKSPSIIRRKCPDFSTELSFDAVGEQGRLGKSDKEAFHSNRLFDVESLLDIFLCVQTSKIVISHQPVAAPTTVRHGHGLQSVETGEPRIAELSSTSHADLDAHHRLCDEHRGTWLLGRRQSRSLLR